MDDTIQLLDEEVAPYRYTIEFHPRHTATSESEAWTVRLQDQAGRVVTATSPRSATYAIREAIERYRRQQWDRAQLP
jgi:hypothetical protein